MPWNTAIAQLTYAYLCSVWEYINLQPEKQAAIRRLIDKYVCESNNPEQRENVLKELADYLLEHGIKN